jgi:formylglycine-generating enzyme required for sulfatase activity
MTGEVAGAGRTGGDMVLVPAGSGPMGSVRYYAEERPRRTVSVPAVWFDRDLVTNAEFARFVEDTGHVTVPEQDLDPADFPGADPDLLVPGSQVFTPTAGPVPLDDWTQWWRWQPGAQWRHPDGPGSSWEDLSDHPVVHVGWEDAQAYAAWVGKRLATEEEWEHAARGGLVDAEFAWGDELWPGGEVLANTWHGPFPWRSRDPHGFDRTSPVGSYPPNGYGLHDMIGNVWEWTGSPWTASHAEEPAPVVPAATCCGGSRRLGEGDRMVTKGGSHLCSPDYCMRYRPAARQGQGVRDTTSHVGFRCVRSAE